jgi:arylformamidase
MNIIDITRTIRDGMEVYPGDPEVEVAATESGVNRISMGSHTGTHVDAPSHLISGGADAGSIPLKILIGPVCVVLAGVTPLDAEAVGAAVPPGCERVLFKLSGRGPGDTSGVTLDVSGAMELARRGTRLVGVEGMSLDTPAAEGLPAHRAILGSGGVVVEGLELAHAGSGTYELICMPMRLEGCDGSPVRAALIEI